jgi:hypothetical protein
LLAQIGGRVDEDARAIGPSTTMATRVRRLRGSFGSQSPQSLPMRGTPVDVPDPSMTSFMPWAFPLW